MQDSKCIPSRRPPTDVPTKSRPAHVIGWYIEQEFDRIHIDQVAAVMENHKIIVVGMTVGLAVAIEESLK